jgi:hypothetical protein
VKWHGYQVVLVQVLDHWVLELLGVVPFVLLVGVLVGVLVVLVSPPVLLLTPVLRQPQLLQMRQTPTPVQTRVLTLQWSNAILATGMLLLELWMLTWMLV